MAAEQLGLQLVGTPIQRHSDVTVTLCPVQLCCGKTLFFRSLVKCREEQMRTTDDVLCVVCVCEVRTDKRW